MPESTAKKTSAPRRSAKKTATKKAVAKKPATPKESAGSEASRKQATAKQVRARKAAAHRLAVREDEAPWTAKELTEVRLELEKEAQRLHAQLAVLESEIAELIRDGNDGAGNDQADVGSNTLERDHEMSLAGNWREMLQQVERALQRIDDGSYGVCERCGNPIGKMRLMAFPRATLCMPCKQREERR
jgi:RNA polymerase-binding transcription factor